MEAMDGDVAAADYAPFKKVKGRTGRKPGTKNKPGHRAGGKRPGAGRPRKHPQPDSESAPRTRRNRPPVLSADTPPPNGDLPVLGPDGLVTGPLHLLLDPALVQVDAAAARANAASADAAARPNAASANAAATPRASTSAATARSRPAPPPVAAPPVEPVFADDEDGFKSDLWHIKREMEADGERSWPVCYQQGSLWYRHGRSPYLVSHIASPALLTSGSNPRQRHDLFLWIPDLLTSKILVCSCGSPLSRHGWNEQPARMVCGLDRVYGLVTCRYQCTCQLVTGCPDAKVLDSESGKKASRRTFQGWDELVINQLPPALQSEFPALLPWRVGVDKTALRLADALSNHGVAYCNVAAIFNRLFSDRLADDPLLANLPSNAVNEDVAMELPQLTDAPPPPQPATTTTTRGEEPLRFAGLKPSAAMRRGALTITFEKRGRAEPVEQAAEPAEATQQDWIV